MTVFLVAYLFKFTAPGGTIHRFQARYDSFEFIIDIIGGKLLADPFFTQNRPSAVPLSPTTTEEFLPLQTTTTTLVDPKDFQLSYLDDDGDLVLMTADRDILDAVSIARKQGKDKVVVQLKGGKTWENELERRRLVEAAKNVVVSDVKSRKASLDAVEESGEEEEEEVKPKKKTSKSKVVEKEDLVFGFLSKDQLLPASVAFLAVAIVGVFAMSKVTAKQ